MRSRIRWVGLGVTPLLVGLLAYGCGQTTLGTCADNGTCVSDASTADGTTGDGDITTDVATIPDAKTPGNDDGRNVTNGDGADADAGPGPCILSGEPKDEPCLLDEAYGVFVSPMGTANGAGTRASPLKSIDAAISLAVPEGGVTPKSVYACAGTYDETITITAARDKVRVFGGFRCLDWVYTGAVATLAPSAAGVPLTLTGLTSALFADLEIDAQSAPSTPPGTGSASGASSIAVLANGATGVVFRRTKIVAGNGQPGADGVLVPYTFPSAADLRGNAADGGAGGPAKLYACPGGLMTSGGKGGDSPAGSGDPGLPALGGGGGDTSAQCVANVIGGVGASPGSASNGNGASSTGSVAGSAWQPGAGAPGAVGSPGQGGGGGAGVDPGGGGSGGAGGCGGAGGGGGGGGGASASVFSVASNLTFTSVALVSATAGNAGIGVAGQAGGSDVGNGGLPDANGGCQGGRGGTGGSGGTGGGGAGGLSAGILYKGTAPTIDTATTSNFVQGQAGLKGTGGVPGTNDGINGPTGIQVLAQ
jgi:hypothetical protein